MVLCARSKSFTAMQDQCKSEDTVSLNIDKFSEFCGPGPSDSLRRVSAPTYIRGLPWKILAIPRAASPSPKKNGGPSSGKEQPPGRYLSFFLQCNTESNDPDWRCNASAVLRVHAAGTVPGVRDITKNIKHTFSAKENDWGYSMFVSLDTLADPKNGYIKNDIIKLCVNVTADMPKGVPPTRTDLMNAASDGDVGLGYVLLEGGADPDVAPVPTTRDTALTIAASKGHDKFVELLVQYNAELNHRNKKGCTAVWLASERGYIQAVRVLVENGADVDIPDNRKITPILIAFRRGHKQVVEFLVHYISQFPQEEELFKYYQTSVLLSNDIEVTKKLEMNPQFPGVKELCQALFESMKIINDHRKKLVMAADNAAWSLLNQIAEEKKIADLRKMRQKEKKKAKRMAKKLGIQNACGNEGTVYNEAEIDEISDRSMLTNSETTVVVDSSPTITTINEPDSLTEVQQKKKKKRARRKKNSKKEELESIEDKHAKRRLSIDELEVCSLGHKVMHVETCIPDQSESMPSTSKSFRSSSHSESSLNLPDDILDPFNIKSKEEEEWIEASKKRNTVKNKRDSLAMSDLDHSLPSTSSNIPTPQSSRPMTFHPVVISSETSPDGRVHIMVLLSSVVARLIGHNGTTINGIREASQSHIIIEKYQPLEKNTRTITIKGEVKQVRTAVKMLETLIQEEDSYDVQPKKDLEICIKSLPSTPLQKSSTSHPAIISSEASSGGRVHVMVLLSSAVARLIGHNGNTINSIRESSSSTIVIEKYRPMEKNTQAITIKGDVRSVKHAVKMIELLIHDADTPIRDIINRVMNKATEGTSPSRKLVKRKRCESSFESSLNGSRTNYDDDNSSSSLGTSEIHDGPLPSDILKTPENKTQKDDAELSEWFTKKLSFSEPANHSKSMVHPLHFGSIDEIKHPSPMSPTTSKFNWELSWSGSKKMSPSNCDLPSLLDQEELRKKAPGYARPTPKRPIVQPPPVPEKNWFDDPIMKQLANFLPPLSAEINFGPSLSMTPLPTQKASRFEFPSPTSLIHSLNKPSTGSSTFYAPFYP